MQCIFAVVLCLLIVFLFWFTGHIVRKELKISEDSEIISHLLNICFGASGFLIVTNLAGYLTKSFTIGFAAALIAMAGIIAWKFLDLKAIYLNSVDLFKTNRINNLIKKCNDKYFWILLGGVNFFYITTAVSSTKIDKIGQGNTHLFNISQLINDIYPPKYSFLPNIDFRGHYGADILGAFISKISGCHPEISLDIITIIFLNLSLLAVFGLSLKFLNSNPLNKYIVPFGVFFAWAPLLTLVSTTPNENIPKNFLEKIYYLTQSRLIDSARWSGLVFNWFFEPASGIGTLFFLIAVYLLYRFFSKGENINFIILVSVFLSSLSIIDFSRFIILIFGILFQLLIFYTPQGSNNNFKDEAELLKKLGILLLTSIILSVIYGNCLRLDKSFIPIVEYYKFGQNNLDPKFNPFYSNTLLLIIFAFGFYQAYKEKQNWIFFILPYFLASFAIPFMISMPSANAGKFFMAANILGAFTLPLVFSFVEKQLQLKGNNLTIFYSSVLVVLSLSSVMFWAFGAKAKPLFAFENNSLKFTGVQKLDFNTIDESIFKDEVAFIGYLKSRNAKNQAIVAEPEFNDVFTSNTGLQALAPPGNTENFPVKKEVIDESLYDYRASFLFNNKTWLTKKIKWLYITPKLFKYLTIPQSRKILLNAYLNKGVKLSLSNKKIDEADNLKELYELDPKLLFLQASDNYPKLLDQFIGSDNKPYYINQLALSPYFGIYSAKSKDYDGDGIADIAFYDQLKKIWYIVNGKDEKETEVDLSTHFFSKGKFDTDLFIPVPSDFDGDGKTDIALFNRITANWYILRSSDSVSENPKRWCSDWNEIPLPGDVNGDHKADVSCFNGDDGRWPTSLSGSGEYFTQNFGNFISDISLYSDIDGDSKADYVIYKPLQSLYQIHLTSCINKPQDSNVAICGGSGASSAIQVSIGSRNARAIPEDYDGDGKIDLATWTPETGKWEFAYAKDVLSKNTVGTQKTFTLGKPGDIPMPGDYNGDGKADIAIYHLDTSKLEIDYENGTQRKINLSKYKNCIPASFIGI